MKHDELQEDLASHLRGGTDRMVWTNTQLGPSGSPRPDVFTVNKSFSRFRSDCYEIKVSMSDLRSDLTSGKWQSYRKYGHAVWFAFPRGMAPLDLIPAECGVILRGETWRAARKPVAQVLDTLPRDAWLKLLMSLDDFDWSKHAPKIRHSADYKNEELVRRKAGAQLAQLFSDVKRAEDSLTYRKQCMEEELARHRTYIEQQRKRDEEYLERDKVALSAELQALANDLGMDQSDMSVSAIRGAVRQLRNSLAGKGIGEAIQLLQRLQGALPEKVA